MATEALKPKQSTTTHYDYHECSAFIDKKYGINQDDYAARFSTGRLDEPKPYQCFWDFVCDKSNLRNDSLFTMSEWWGEDAEEWQKSILGYYMDEFGTGKSGDRSITFWVSW